jgi:hypothetical protein
MVTLLENLNLVKMLEGLLQALYVFFVHSSKKFLETCQLNQHQGNKLLYSIKMFCFILSPTKCMSVEYH